MPESQDNLQQEMEKLLVKAQARKRDNSVVKFPGESIHHLRLSIDQPIIGILAHLNESTKAFYSQVSCIISGPKIKTTQFHIDDNPDLDHLFGPISPRTHIDIAYLMENANEEFDIAPFNEKMSIYFDHDWYELSYQVAAGDDQRLRVTYDTNVSVDQIRTLRKLISDAVVRRVAAMIGG